MAMFEFVDAIKRYFSTESETVTLSNGEKVICKPVTVKELKKIASVLKKEEFAVLPSLQGKSAIEQGMIVISFLPSCIDVIIDCLGELVCKMDGDTRKPLGVERITALCVVDTAALIGVYATRFQNDETLKEAAEIAGESQAPTTTTAKQPEAGKRETTSAQ